MKNEDMKAQLGETQAVFTSFNLHVNSRDRFSYACGLTSPCAAGFGAAERGSAAATGLMF